MSQVTSLLNSFVANTCRPDGTELIKQQRSALYQSLRQTIKQGSVAYSSPPKTANIAIFATYKTNEQAIEDVCFYIENNLSDVIQLPELFFVADKAITHDVEQLAHIEVLSERLIEQVSQVLRPFQYVCTSLVIKGNHQAVIISEDGIFATQQQLHFCERYRWTALGHELTITDLPLEQGYIKVAMLSADDALIPEMLEIASLKHIQVLFTPLDIQEANEYEAFLLTQAKMLRICIVAATREKSFAPKILSNGDNNHKKANAKKVTAKKSTGFIIDLTQDTILVKHQHGKITKAVIHPIRAINKT